MHEERRGSVKHKPHRPFTQVQFDHCGDRKNSEQNNETQKAGFSPANKIAPAISTTARYRMPTSVRSGIDRRAHACPNDEQGKNDGVCRQRPARIHPRVLCIHAQQALDSRKHKRSARHRRMREPPARTIHAANSCRIDRVMRGKLLPIP